MRKRSGVKKQNRDRSRHCKRDGDVCARASCHSEKASFVKRVAFPLSENIAFQNISDGGDAHNENSSIVKEGAAKWRGEVSGCIGWTERDHVGREESAHHITQHNLEGIAISCICPGLFASEAIFSLFRAARPLDTPPRQVTD